MSRRSGEARLLREALAIEAEEAQAAGALGFMARLLVQTTLPHSRREELSFVRSNGRLHVSVTAHPLLGLPYGRYPRLLLAWVTTEAVRTKSRHLRLGPSLSRFMVRLGLTPSGGPNGPIGRLREQMRRLFGATIAFTQDGRSDGEWHDAGFRVAREVHLWWDPQVPRASGGLAFHRHPEPGLLRSHHRAARAHRPAGAQSAAEPLGARPVPVAHLPQQLSAPADSSALGAAGTAAWRGVPGSTRLQAQGPAQPEAGSGGLPDGAGPAGAGRTAAAACTLPRETVGRSHQLSGREKRPQMLGG